MTGEQLQRHSQRRTTFDSHSLLTALQRERWPQIGIHGSVCASNANVPMRLVWTCKSPRSVAVQIKFFAHRCIKPRQKLQILPISETSYVPFSALIQTSRYLSTVQIRRIDYHIALLLSNCLSVSHLIDLVVTSPQLPRNLVLEIHSKVQYVGRSRVLGSNLSASGLTRIESIMVGFDKRISTIGP
jgi:hypothetical protein